MSTFHGIIAASSLQL